MGTHRLYHRRYDPGHQALSSRVCHGNDTRLRIGKEHWNAVSDQHSQHSPRCRRHHGIGLRRWTVRRQCPGLIDNFYIRAMHLVQVHHVGRGESKAMCQQLAISHDRVMAIADMTAQVQLVIWARADATKPVSEGESDPADAQVVAQHE
jgi:hypothetical protein